jgi:hypothetical protein
MFLLEKITKIVIATPILKVNPLSILPYCARRQAFCRAKKKEKCIKLPYIYSFSETFSPKSLSFVFSLHNFVKNLVLQKNIL